MPGASAALDRLRRPEYTGENRCVPCTATNLVLGLAGAVAVGLLVPVEAAPVLGGAVFLVSVGAIYLRGYLIPGTPWFTRTYFPDRLLRAFEKQPATTTPDGDVDLDVETTLVEAGAIEECDDVEDLCLTPAFRTAWRERIDELRREDTSREDLARLLDVDVDGLTFSEFGDAFSARSDGVRVGQWESEAAFLADVAAATVLETRTDAWSGLTVAQRGELLTGLRLFVERCPTCEGPVTLAEETTRSCCRSFEVVAATCSDCGARLFEAELPEAA